MTPRERVSQAVRVVKDGSLFTWNSVVIVFQWTMAPLVSHWKGLSLVRFLAVFCAGLVGHEVFVHEKALTWIDFWLMLAAFAAAFGKPVFAIFLSRVGLRSASTDMTLDAKIRQEIVERRAQGKEWDAEVA